jgi:hypothetical protein
MKDRIKELADEARIKFSAHWAHQGVDTAVITRLDLKEFAELIVQECMKLNRDILCEDDPDYLDKIYKEHFGVRE